LDTHHRCASSSPPPRAKNIQKALTLFRKLDTIGRPFDPQARARSRDELVTTARRFFKGLTPRQWKAVLYGLGG